jgi:hypothetical protein
MFGIDETGDKGSMKSPKEIEQPYKHTIIQNTLTIK